MYFFFFFFFFFFGGGGGTITICGVAVSFVEILYYL